jgi:hypothetical protein
VSTAPLVFRSVGIPLAKRPPSPPPTGAGGGLAAEADAVDDDCGMGGGAPMPGMGGRAIPPPPPEGLGFTSILCFSMLSLFPFTQTYLQLEVQNGH